MKIKGSLIFIYMACHYLYFNNQNEFYSSLKRHDLDITLKMVKCIISASKRNKDSIDIFDIGFKNMSSMLFSIDKNEYKNCLENCMNTLIEAEEYEICTEIVKILNKKEKKIKRKSSLT